MSLAALLAERERRRSRAEASTAKQRDYAGLAADLRSWYHPRQAAFLTSKAKRRAALCTRRAGKTAGVCREFLARGFETPGCRLMYVNEVREEARRLFWRADTKQGVIDLLETYEAQGRIKIARDRRDLMTDADVKFDETTLTIDFRNGSQIRVFAADDERAQNRARGAAPHVVDVDESQKFPRLRNFVEEIVGPSLKDFDGECWLTGTPSQDQSGLFYDVTANDNDEALATRERGWEVHEWSVVDNPWFGDTPEERWERAIGAELREKGIDPLRAPEWVLREWRAQWAKETARFVYWVHRAPQPLTYAPLRTTPHVPQWLTRCDPMGKDPSGISGWIDRWYDHATSLLDLPGIYAGTHERPSWHFALGLDFGYNPHPFANTLWAFNDRMPDLWEMWSWKRTLVIPEWQKDCALWYWREVPGLDYMVGDPGGQAGANMEGWRQLTGMPIEDADKVAKVTWQEMLNNAIVQGLVHFRDGSPLLHEMKHLTWVQRGAKMVESDDRKLNDGTVPGNDASDSALYSARWIITHRPPVIVPTAPHGTPAWYAEQEAAMRRAVDQATERQLAAEAGMPDDWGAY